MARTWFVCTLIACLAVVIVKTNVIKVDIQQCSQTYDEKQECGYYGIQEPECASRGCCWQPTEQVNAPWCFHTKEVTTTTTTKTTTSAPETDLCPPDYIFGGNCYIIRPEPLPWLESRQDCRTMGGHLVDIADQTEMNHVTHVLSTWPENTLVWIGLNDRVHEGKFVWGDSTERAAFTNWRRGEPNDDYGKEDCASSYTRPGAGWQGKWNDITCLHDEIPHMCEIPTGVTPYVSTPVPPTQVICDVEGIYEGRCYKILPTFRNWADSQSDCQQQGGNLVSISNAAEMKHVSGVLDRWPAHTLVWIGLTDKRGEGNFVWSDTYATATYTNWRRGEPNDDYGKEDCAAAYAVVDREWLGRWNDIPCSEHGIPYMCEFPNSNVGLPGAPDVCDDRFIYKGYCYKIVNEIKNWQQANDDCMRYSNSLGVGLVDITDAAEQRHVSYVLSEHPSETMVWIGLNDQEDEGRYVWGSGREATYTNWRRGEPNDDWGKEDCVAAYASPGRDWLGLWNDVPCSESGIPFMCKFPIK